MASSPSEGLVAGLLFIAVGIAAIVIAQQLPARHRRADGARLFPAHPRHPADRPRRGARAARRCGSTARRFPAGNGGPCSSCWAASSCSA